MSVYVMCYAHEGRDAGCIRAGVTVLVRHWTRVLGTELRCFAWTADVLVH